MIEFKKFEEIINKIESEYYDNYLLWFPKKGNITKSDYKILQRNFDYNIHNFVIYGKNDYHDYPDVKLQKEYSKDSFTKERIIELFKIMACIN